MANQLPLYLPMEAARPRVAGRQAVTTLMVIVPVA